MPVKPHPFYCFKKGCRKTAHETPEYLETEDWDLLRQVVKLMEEKKIEEMWRLLYPVKKDERETGKKFFYCSVGWPEGYVYCHSTSYFEGTGFNGLLKDLKVLKSAVEKYDGIQRVQ